MDKVKALRVKDIDWKATFWEPEEFATIIRCRGCPFSYTDYGSDLTPVTLCCILQGGVVAEKGIDKDCPLPDKEA